MALSPVDFSCDIADAPPFAPRVFRYRKLINGCRAWYAVDRSGEMIAPGLRVVWPGESESEIVAELIRAADEANRPVLRLIPPSRPVPMSPAVFARIVRARLPQ